MNEQEYTNIINALAVQNESEQVRRMKAENDIARMSGMGESLNRNIVELQLDLDKIKDDIKNSLLGRELKKVNGNEVWVDSSDDRTRTWSDLGVKEIMKMIHAYINPSTLLSCYTIEDIKAKMNIIGEAINDNIFNQLEMFLHYPTPEELYRKYLPVVKGYGMNITDEELYNKCIEWSVAELRRKENNYEITVIQICHAIENTYRRALNGEERESLRKQMMIHQSLQNNNQVQMQPMRGMK